jgi:hypothetical protein
MRLGTVDFGGHEEAVVGLCLAENMCTRACFTNWRFSMHRVETAAKGVNNGCNSIVGINEIS